MEDHPVCYIHPMCSRGLTQALFGRYCVAQPFVFRHQGAISLSAVVELALLCFDDDLCTSAGSTADPSMRPFSMDELEHECKALPPEIPPPPVVLPELHRDGVERRDGVLEARAQALELN
jgi:hypothetical protein